MDQTSLQFLMGNQWLLLFVILWVLPWKGVALWKAARKNHLGWFVALLVLNTMAVLEILYIFIFSKKPAREPAVKEPEDKKD